MARRFVALVILVVAMLVMAARGLHAKQSFARSTDTPIAGVVARFTSQTAQGANCDGAGCTCSTTFPGSGSGIAMYDLGDQVPTGSQWSFSGDFCVSAGAWESVTISNYGWCFSGPNDPRAGTAHAGAIYWYAELESAPPTNAGYAFTGNLVAEREQSTANISGSVTVTAGADLTTTHIDASLSDSSLAFFQGNPLKVCLLGSS